MSDVPNATISPTGTPVVPPNWTPYLVVLSTVCAAAVSAAAIPGPWYIKVLSGVGLACGSLAGVVSVGWRKQSPPGGDQ